MRHAKSSWDNPGLPDHDRPLNPRGQRSARALGDWLRAHQYVPDAVITSSSKRTLETLSSLRLDCHVDVSTALFHANPDTILNVLRRSDAASVLLIGHNPGIGDFADRILREPVSHPRFADFPTGATLVADFEIEAWSAAEWQSGTAIDFTVPRDLTS